MNSDRSKGNFDTDAAKWDEHPGRVKLAHDIARKIVQEVGLTPDMDLLDFGCGSGLVTLALLPFVRSITGVDGSRGMLDVLNRKISERGLSNINTSYLDFDQGGVLSGLYHLVVSSMTLHHIREIGPLLKQFHDILHPSGRLCVADLDEDGGRFHESNDGVFHFGFNRERLARQFEEAGFSCIQTTCVAQIEKPVAEGMRQHFTIFLMTATR